MDGIPATVFRPASGPAGPAVVIAHGFAGSQQLMRSFATTLARNGYVAVTFDFAGHARNPAPLTGSIIDADGATRTLLAETAQIAGFARPLGDGRLAVLGHSMASDIVVRFSEATPGVGATIAVSMFSPEVTATEPRNLLVIVGGWEGMLKREALRAVGLATAPAAAVPGVTYGDPPAAPRAGPPSARMSSMSACSTAAPACGKPWIGSTGRSRSTAPADRSSWCKGRGSCCCWPVWCCWPGPCRGCCRASLRLPPGRASGGGGCGCRSVVPMIATPLLLRVLPTHFLPVLVGDYLAAHFAVYGLVTAACLAWLRRTAGRPARSRRFLAAASAVVAYGFVGLVWPINAFVTSFLPGRERAVLILAMLVGTLLYFLADEWLTRGPGAARGGYAVVEARIPRLAGDRRCPRFRAAVLPDHHHSGDRAVLSGLRPVQRLDLPEHRPAAGRGYRRTQ